ncbi:MAG: hypothetical protein K5888_07985 [Lachnospiraceae bacterium]|nr:hypothetical protein [Lachnospiraceae bacterium]
MKNKTVQRIIKVILICFVMLFLMAPCLGGCAKVSDKETSESDDDDDDDDRDAEKKTKKKKNKKKKKDEEPVEEPPEEEATGVFAEAFRNGEVENNGDWYVRVGDKVYFRIFNKSGLERITYMGDCILEVPDDSLESMIYTYDLNTDEYGEYCKTIGTGKLFAVSEGLLLADQTSNGTVLIPMDGSEGKRYLDGIPKAVSEDGRYLVTADYKSGADMTYDIYHDGEKTGEIEKGQDDYIDIYGFVNGRLITMNCNYSDDTYTICSYDEKGDVLALGEMSDFFDEISGYPELGQMITDGEKAYLTVGFYDGTGHFLQCWEFLEADPAREDGLKKIEKKKTYTETEGDPFIPKLSFNGSGEAVLSDHVKGELALSEGLYGDLVYYETPTQGRAMVRNFIYEQKDDSYGLDYLQDAVVFDEDKAFIIMGTVVRDELSDIGWRSAYRLESLSFIKLSFAPEDLDDEGYVYLTVYLESLYSGGWNKGDFEYEDLVGTWDLYSYDSEGYHGYVEDDGYVEKLVFEPDGSVRLETYNNDPHNPDTKRSFYPAESEGENMKFFYDTGDDGGNLIQLYIIAVDDGRLDADVTSYYSDGTPGGYYGIFMAEGSEDAE